MTFFTGRGRGPWNEPTRLARSAIQSEYSNVGRVTLNLSKLSKTWAQAFSHFIDISSRTDFITTVCQCGSELAVTSTIFSLPEYKLSSKESDLG